MMLEYYRLTEELRITSTESQVNTPLNNLFTYFDSLSGGPLTSLNGVYMLDHTIVDYTLSRLKTRYYTLDTVKKFIASNNGAFDRNCDMNIAITSVLVHT